MYRSILAKVAFNKVTWGTRPEELSFAVDELLIAANEGQKGTRDQWMLEVTLGPQRTSQTEKMLVLQKRARLALGSVK